MGESGKAIVFSVNRFKNGGRVPVGGFADRIKGMFFVYYLSHLTGREFYVDWNFPDDLSESFDLNGRLWSGRQGGECELDLIDKNFDDELKADLGRGGSDFLRKTNNVDVLVVNCNSFPMDVIWSYADFYKKFDLPVDSLPAIFSFCFRELLPYLPKDRFLDYERSFNEFKDRCNFILGVQFRVGGSASGWRDPELDSIDNIPELKKVIVDFLDSKSIDKFGVFITTDNEMAKFELVKMAKELGAPVFYFDEKSEHIDRSDKELARRMSSQIYFEHYLLAACDQIVIGKGGFGLTAAYRKGVNPINYHRYQRVNGS